MKTTLNEPMVAAPDKTAVNLLWTGGWDSTFRLLSLALIHHVAVQPYYVVLPFTHSLAEISAMGRIRRRLQKLSSEHAALIKPAILISFYDIEPDATMTAHHEQLKSRSYLGGQYAWLAACVRQFHIPHLELCVHLDDKAHAFLESNVEEVKGSSCGDYWKLRESNMQGELAIFSYFRFPLLALTKTQMLEISREHGFMDIMKETWFCHEPVRDKPCGVCNPCRYAVEEGMGWRIPRSGHLRRRFWPVCRTAHAGTALLRKLGRSTLVAIGLKRKR